MLPQQEAVCTAKSWWGAATDGYDSRRRKSRFGGPPHRFFGSPQNQDTSATRQRVDVKVDPLAGVSRL